MDLNSESTMTCGLVLLRPNSDESEVAEECSTKAVSTEQGMTEAPTQTVLTQPCVEPQR